MSRAPDARSLDVKGLEDLRRRVAAAVVEQGMRKSAAARVFGLSRTTIHKWARLYRTRGASGLTPKRRGRTRQSGRLKGWQAATIVNLITDRCPDQLKLPFALWTREAVRELIRERFGIEFSLSTVGRLLKRWGFTPQKPVRRAYERQDREIKRWLQEEYPAIHRRAKRENAEIHWGDQMGLRSHDQVGRSYGRRGQPPVVRSPGKRFACNVISTITNLGKLAFLVFTARFTGVVLIEFLERLVKHARRKVFLILDGHPVHRSARLRQWLAKHQAQLELFSLPPYAPELNPDELLNHDVKANAFRHGRPRNQQELIAGTQSYLRATKQRPDIVRAYFQEPLVNYAAHR